MTLSEWLRSYFMPWRWPRRWRCHRGVRCCQFVDRPNDNRRGVYLWLAKQDWEDVVGPNRIKFK